MILELEPEPLLELWLVPPEPRPAAELDAPVTLDEERLEGVWEFFWDPG